jgi:hypothetical protein
MRRSILILLLMVTYSTFSYAGDYNRNDDRDCASNCCSSSGYYAYKCTPKRVFDSDYYKSTYRENSEDKNSSKSYRYKSYDNDHKDYNHKSRDYRH